MKTPWRERKLRCKLGFHSNPDGILGAGGYQCKLCGTMVNYNNDIGG